MEFSYFEPAPALRELVSSYYFISLPVEAEDIMRAEIANVRFILDGTIMSDLSGAPVELKSGDAPLCGPTYRWSRLRFSAGARAFGAAITPLGWRRLFSVSAEELANTHAPLEDFVPPQARPLIGAVFEADSKEAAVSAADALFSSFVSHERRVHDDFIEQATRWIVDPEPNEIEHLIDQSDLSHRQIERLCKAYFGAGPKKLHRKFRALHAANRLIWMNLSDWREIARAAYYDQAHFIREFKQFNGRTPQEFIDGPNFLVRLTLQERLKINHGSPFSLVG